MLLRVTASAVVCVLLMSFTEFLYVHPSLYTNTQWDEGSGLQQNDSLQSLTLQELAFVHISLSGRLAQVTFSQVSSCGLY